MRSMATAVLIAAFATTSIQAQGVSIKPGKDGIDFYAGGELVTTYQTTKYSRPIFWPLMAGGVPVTRAWPMVEGGEGVTKDHPHQKSCWFVWGDVIPEGIESKDKRKGIKGIDFWAEGHGKLVVTKVGEPRTGKGRASISTHNEWRMPDGTKILDEDRNLHFYDFGKARLIVFDIDLHASVCPITFGDTKEGAMGVRVNDHIMADKRGKGKIQNAQGKINESECWGQYSEWCDYSGPIDGKLVGVAILCDPKNPHQSAWHTRGYGLHAANPFGRAGAKFPATKDRTDLVRLEKGEHIRFRYGVLVHEGDAATGNVAEYYQRFVNLRDEQQVAQVARPQEEQQGGQSEVRYNGRRGLLGRLRSLFGR